MTQHCMDIYQAHIDGKLYLHFSTDGWIQQTKFKSVDCNVSIYKKYDIGIKWESKLSGVNN